MTDDDLSFRLAEFRALRAELEMRIILQNLQLLLLWILFSGCAIFQLLRPDLRYQSALVFVVAAVIVSLFWAHSGARTVQISAYVRDVLEARMGDQLGWESWHVRNPIQGRLGSRWLISTKGVMLGAPGALVAHATLAGPPDDTRQMVALILSCMGLLAAGVLLIPEPRCSSVRP